MSFQQLLPFIQQRLVRMGAAEAPAELASYAIGIILVIFLAFLANWAAKAVIRRVIARLVKRTPWDWDDILLEHQVFTRLSHLAPALVISSLGGSVLGEFNQIVQTAVQVYILVIILMVFSALLNAGQFLLGRTTAGAGIPIKGFIQATKLVLSLIGGILILSILFGRSPVYFLSGIGALTAVMLLIFRDALLGLVAGVMISVNRMVRVGDWIEMPDNGADGDVIDVSLTTVKVRNWDRTISTIPSYDLISKSFKNWQGMFDSGGRRIKRSIFIDMQTIRFADDALLEKWRQIRVLRPYLDGKEAEIEAESQVEQQDLTSPCNVRRLTNVGTFRAYCTAYLQQHPRVNRGLTHMVRQLAPTEHGLPMEIYLFTKDTRWVDHEAVQADIFDHLLSVIGEFNLRVFQEPSGHDLREGFQLRR